MKCKFRRFLASDSSNLRLINNLLAWHHTQMVSVAVKLHSHIVGNHTWSHPDMSKISTQEGFSYLDSKTSDEVIALLKMTAKKYGQTIVMITHDDEIAQVADRILVIEDGQVVDFR